MNGQTRSMLESKSKTVISYIHKLIRTDKFSPLIALIYDKISENCDKEFLKKTQVEIIFSLLYLPNPQIPNVVSYADLCSLLKNAYDDKFGNKSSKNDEGKLSKSKNDWDEQNLEEMDILATLNSFRNRTFSKNSDIFNIIRQENLIRTIMRQAWQLQRLKKDLYEMEQEMNYLVAHYIAEKYCACQASECLESDSGCHTDRSGSSNHSTTKLSQIKTDGTDKQVKTAQNSVSLDNYGRKEMNSCQKTEKLLNDSKKSLSTFDEQHLHHINNKKSSSIITSTSSYDVQAKDDLSVSINQIFDDMRMKDEKISRDESNSKNLLDASSTKNQNLSNVKLATKNLFLSNDLRQINQSDHLPMSVIQSVIGTNYSVTKFSKKFPKLQPTTTFECLNYNKQNPCKKIELKKFVEFDTSSYWNKK